MKKLIPLLCLLVAQSSFASFCPDEFQAEIHIESIHSQLDVDDPSFSTLQGTSYSHEFVLTQQTKKTVGCVLTAREATIEDSVFCEIHSVFTGIGLFKKKLEFESYTSTQKLIRVEAEIPFYDFFGFWKATVFDDSSPTKRSIGSATVRIF
jgi:hypothetical protein